MYRHARAKSNKRANYTLSANGECGTTAMPTGTDYSQDEYSQPGLGRARAWTRGAPDAKTERSKYASGPVNLGASGPVNLGASGPVNLPVGACLYAQMALRTY